MDTKNTFSTFRLTSIPSSSSRTTVAVNTMFVVIYTFSSYKYSFFLHKMVKIIIAGISETYYVGEKYDDSETNIDPKPAIRVAHVIYGFINDEKIAIHLDADDSIYHTSYLWYDFSIRQNAYVKAELVPNFKPFSYVPKYNVMEI